jgi:hypothetical protein
LSFNGSVLSAKVKQNDARYGKLTVKVEGGSGHDLSFQNSNLALNSKVLSQNCSYKQRYKPVLSIK